MTKIVNIETVLNVVEKARKNTPFKGDLNFAKLAHAKLGSPVIVHTPTGEPDYWFVPFVIDKYACGSAHVDLSGKIIRLGIFGGSPNDRNSWIPSEFFYDPPAEFINEIKSKYANAKILSVIFSYDSTPVKWAWVVQLVGRNLGKRIVFITPSGWYEKSLGGLQGTMEG